MFKKSIFLSLIVISSAIFTPREQALTINKALVKNGALAAIHLAAATLTLAKTLKSSANALSYARTAMPPKHPLQAEYAKKTLKSTAYAAACGLATFYLIKRAAEYATYGYRIASPRYASVSN